MGSCFASNSDIHHVEAAGVMEAKKGGGKGRGGLETQLQAAKHSPRWL